MSMLFENAARSFGVEERLLLVVRDVDPRGVQRFRVLVREQQDRLGHVAHVALDEKWLVLLDQLDDVPPGNVAVVDDRESGAVEVQRDRRARAHTESSSEPCARRAYRET